METPDKSQVDREAWEHKVQSFSQLLSEESVSRLLVAEDWLIELILKCENGKGAERGPFALAKYLMQIDAGVANMQACDTKYGFAFEYLNIASSVARNGIQATLASKIKNGRAAYGHKTN